MEKRAKVAADWNGEQRTLEMSWDGRVVRLHGGPTGYESFNVDTDGDRAMLIDNVDKGWTANFGGFGRPTVLIPGPEFHRALLELGVIG